jgi:hypothetical protein
MGNCSHQFYLVIAMEVVAPQARIPLAASEQRGVIWSDGVVHHEIIAVTVAANSRRCGNTNTMVLLMAASAVMNAVFGLYIQKAQLAH